MTAEIDEKDPIEVEIAEVDPPAADIVIEEPAAKAPETETKADSVDSALQTLKEQLETERRARAEAERRANEAAQTAHTSRTEAQDANLHLITNAIQSVEQSNEILKANYRAAMAESDFDTVAEIQMEMSSNAAKLQKLHDGKIALESALKTEAPRPYAADPVELLAAQLTPRSAAWVRAHPEFATDQRRYSAMLAAHNLAVANGEEPDSDGYFAAVEESLRIRQPARQVDDIDPLADAAKPTQRRSAPPAAPVSRSTGVPGTRPNRVTLSAEEREMAGMMGLTPEEYARNKLALIKDGRLH